MDFPRKGNIDACRAEPLKGCGGTFLNFMLQRCNFLHSGQAVVAF